MRLTFRLRFRTNFGQTLWLLGDHPLFGGGDIERALPLEYLNPECWQLTLLLPRSEAPNAKLVYNYVLLNPDGSRVYDWGGDRAINPALVGPEDVLLIDSWNHAGFTENVFYTEPFKRVLCQAAPIATPSFVLPFATHSFRVKSPLLPQGQTLCLLGAPAALRAWNTSEPILLGRSAAEDFFSVQLDLTDSSFPVNYKYGVYDLEHRAFLRYEEGDNRVLVDSPRAREHTIVNDGFVRLPTPRWRGAGVAIPVFSLRSSSSFGVGEFTDLKPLVDWCRKTGLKLIQILPINDTSATLTWRDSYPYAAISAFALHPLYLNLDRLAVTAEARRLLASLQPERQRLNTLDKVDYEPVIKAKRAFAKQVFLAQRGQTDSSPQYREFFERNKAWLEPYAAFCCLRDRYGAADCNQWPAYRQYEPDVVARLGAEEPSARDHIALSYFIQYHLHLQLKEAIEYAHANGVILKGDIPIGVYRHGADAWQRPELYHLDVQAGAPPDAFALKGQNWGFPTYNWPRMRQDGFAWWKQRFHQMSEYFDAFRIDHVLGFFRIWSIPSHAVEGILGHFVPAIPVGIEDFRRWNIPFDRDRFSQPFITDQVLEAVLDDHVETARNFLIQGADGAHRFKPEFSTQRAIERHFAGHQRADGECLKQGLYDLLSNVLLLEADGTSSGDQFHFRFAMENTSSFKHLDPDLQSRLRDLYVDYFFRRQDDFWRAEGMRKLPALKRATNMLVCGEDLGLVPACVPQVLSQLGLLSLEIQRMPKDPGRKFFRPRDAPYLSVVTPSTHDMSTIRGWWKEDAGCAQRFFNEELGISGQAPPHCESWINEAVVHQHLAAPAQWSIFQLQDLLGMDDSLRRPNPEEERINDPSIPQYYWRYRMHLSLEALNRAEAFNGRLQEAVRQHARSP